MKTILAILCFVIPAVFASSAQIQPNPAQQFSVKIAWTPNPDSDNVTQYRLYSGFSAGLYNDMTTFQRDTLEQVVIDGDSGNYVGTTTQLPLGRTIFMALTAVNREGLESLPSVEIQYAVPDRPHPPGFPIVITVQQDGTVTIE